MHAPVSFSPRVVDAEGTIEGYASLFGALDSARDMVAPGAFRETLELRGLRRIPMLRPGRADRRVAGIEGGLARALCARPAHSRRAARA